MLRIARVLFPSALIRGDVDGFASRVEGARGGQPVADGPQSDSVLDPRS